MKKRLCTILGILFSFALMAQTDYYWVGGSGNWSDLNHWAMTSGGSTLHTTLPTSQDDVYLDANSFSGASQSVTVDQEATCRSMAWTGATNFPTLTSAGVVLNIHGSLTLITDMTTDLEEVDFEATTTGHTITTGGTPLTGATVRFRGVAGGWSFQDVFETQSIYFYAGTLSTNDNEIIANSRFEMSFSDSKTLNLGASNIEAGIWNNNASGAVINAGTSSITSGNFSGGPGNQVYHDLIISYQSGSFARLDDNTTFNSITIPAGLNLRFDAGDVFTVTDFIANGTKIAPIKLYTDVEGTQASINKTSGAVNLDWVEIQDLSATGGASFTINNATDNGNNTGWTINAYSGDDYYWVGNGGNWSDYGTHWATASGGSTMHTSYPDHPKDNVFFDANSFSSTNQRVTQDVDGGVNIQNMDWAGVTNVPELWSNFGDAIKAYGSVTFVDNMETNLKEFELQGTTAGLAFAPGANLNIFSLNFLGSGEYDLLGGAHFGSFTHRDGTINYNGVEITCDFNFRIGVDGYLTSPVANFGGASIITRDFLKSADATHTINGSHTITLTRNFEGNGATYDHIVMDGNGTISGSNTFQTLEAAPGATVILEAGSTQTAASLVLDGEKPLPINLGTSSSGTQATLSVSSGTVNAIHLVMQDMAATGGATFNAAQTVDNGNNTGWNITPITGIDYYWVGEGGSWSDYQNHWAKSSGGVDMHLDLPGVLDNVIFDANSFSASGQTVLMDQNVSINDMDWTGVTNAPTLNANGNDLNVYGSLTFIEQMATSLDNVYFLSDEVETISGGDELPGTSAYYHFTGVGSWTFQSGVKVRELIQHSGQVNFNNQNVHIDFKLSFEGTDPKSMLLGTSSLFARTLNTYTSENITFDGSSSSVTLSGSFVINNETVNTFDFNDFSFIKYNPTDQGTLIRDFTFNTLTFGPGTDIRISQGLTITVNQLVATGTAANPISILGAGGIATISQSSGTVNAEFLVLENLAATGGGEFNALSSLNNGNVTGWNFNKLDQTISFDPVVGKVFGDGPFDLAATATSGLDVSFSILSGDATLSGNTVTINGAGDIQVLAEQAGNITHFPAPSVTQTITIAKASQDIVFSPAVIPDKMVDDAPFTFDVSVSTGFALDVTGSENLSVVTTGNPGEYEVELLGAGTGVITATQAGTSNYASTEESMAFEILKYDQSIAFDPLPARTFGEMGFELAATASSGLTVVYASSEETVATVSGTTVSIIGAGSTTITASQAGNATYNAASDEEQLFTVNKAAQAITFDPLLAKTFGDLDFELAATTSSGLPVTYASSDETVATVAGTIVTIVGAGTATITASQEGDDNYSGAEDIEQLLTVKKADQAINFDPLASKTVGDEAFELAATASSGLVVTYASSDETVATISGTTVTIAGAGNVTITASQVGDANYNGAVDVTQLLTVNKSEQTITFEPIGEKTYGDEDFVINATSSSGLQVSLTSSDKSMLSITGTRATILTAGTVTITATQDGDEKYKTASDSYELTISKAGQTITFAPLPDFNLSSDEPIALAASSNAGLEVSFNVSGPARLENGILVPQEVGEVVVVAVQAGNANYEAAESVEQRFQVMDEPLGLEDPSEGFTVYPNPSSDVVWINSLMPGAKIILLDLNGKRVWEGAYRSEGLPLTSFQSGQYIISITAENQTLHRRLLISR